MESKEITEAIGRIPGHVPVIKTPIGKLITTTGRLKDVATNKDRDRAGAYLTRLHEVKKEITGHFKPFADALNKAHKAITGKRGLLVADIETEQTRLKRIIGDYDRAEQARRDAEQARLNAELEVKRKAQQEKIKEAGEAEARELAAQGRDAEAEAVRDVAANEPEIPKTEVIVPDTKSKPSTSSLKETMTWKFRVVDTDKVIAAVAARDAPSSVLMVNESVVRALVKAQKMAFNVPGIEAYEEKGYSPYSR